MSLATFEALLRQHQLERLAPVLSDLVLPAIAFDLRREEVPLGQSRVGGRPELPADFRWPMRRERPSSDADHATDVDSDIGEESGDGSRRPLDYLLQIHLADLPLADLTGPLALLPQSGTLSFFYDRREQPRGLELSEGCGHWVHYSAAETPLRVTARPEGTTAAPECALQVRTITTLPAAGSKAFDAVVEENLDAEEMERYFSLEEAVVMQGSREAEGAHHHCCGHAESLQGDLQRGVQQLHLKGEVSSEAANSAGSASVGNDSAGNDSLGSIEGADSSADEWLLLLQLDSDDEAEFDWGETGILFFWIRRSDLVARRFDRTWAVLQSF